MLSQDVERSIFIMNKKGEFPEIVDDDEVGHHVIHLIAPLTTFAIPGAVQIHSVNLITAPKTVFRSALPVSLLYIDFRNMLWYYKCGFCR